MAPDQTYDDIDALPRRCPARPAQDPSTVAWPEGDWIDGPVVPEGVDEAALERAAAWVFDEDKVDQATLSFLVVQGGEIILERYAPGVTMTTRTGTWSAAKSIASTVLGIAVDQGLLELDAPLPIEWLPDELNEYRARYRSGMSVWDMAAEVLQASPEREGGAKPESVCGGVG